MKRRAGGTREHCRELGFKCVDGTRYLECDHIMPKAPSPVARPAPIWRGFATSARRPCHASSPRTAPASRSNRRVAAPIDTDNIDETVLELLRLTRHNRARAWKGRDWEALNRLHRKGMIGDPVGVALSVVIC